MTALHRRHEEAEEVEVGADARGHVHGEPDVSVAAGGDRDRAGGNVDPACPDRIDARDHDVPVVAERDLRGR